MKRLRRRITRSDAFITILAAVATSFIVLYARTLRVRLETHPGHDELDPARILYGFWHGRQFLLVPTFRGSGIAIMTDLSWAGEVQTRILTKLGYTPVRGSTRRQAPRALADIRRAIEDGHPAAFAVDGPRGPIHRSKPGILYLARKLRYPIIPVATSAKPAWTIGTTWCRYLLPLPFATCLVALGKPIRGAADGALSNEELDVILSDWTAEADLAVGREP